MQNNFFLLSKSCYENNYIAIDQNKINSILATTDNYKFSLRSRCRKGQGIGRKQKGDVDWGEILACHAGYYKFSHKHIKPAHTGNVLIDTHNMTHLSLIFPNSDRMTLCFHSPTHPTLTTLGVLLNLSSSQVCVGGCCVLKL